MDWTQIILALVGFIGGGGIVTLTTLKTKKGREEVKLLDEAMALIHKLEDEKHVELKIKDERIETIEAAYSEKVAKLEAQINSKVEKIMQLQQALFEKTNECVTKGQFICVNMGCCLRCPAVGRGKLYFDAHKDDENFGANYYPTEELMSRHKRKVYDWSQKPPKTLAEAKEEYEKR